MNSTRSILRVVFFALTILLLVYVNKKTDDNTASIAEFKFKMMERILQDSLDNKHKVDLLLNETTKFIDNSSHVRKGIHYLIAMLTLWGATELIFLILDKRNYGEQETK